MEEFSTIVTRPEWYSHGMDGRGAIKNLQGLSKRGDSEYTQKFSRANDQVYEPIWARFTGTQGVLRLVEDSARSSNRNNPKRKHPSSN